jgi:hypothetical protein
MFRVSSVRVQTLRQKRASGGRAGGLEALLNQADFIKLTIPNERGFFGVVRLLVGGLAVRLDLAYEQMDDLQLAVESVLLDGLPKGRSVTLEAFIEDQQVVVWVGPVAPRIRARDERKGTIDFDRLLATLVDQASIVERIGQSWLCLAKRIPTRSG